MRNDKDLTIRPNKTSKSFKGEPTQFMPKLEDEAEYKEI